MSIAYGRLVTLSRLKNEWSLPFVWSSPDHGAGPDIHVTLSAFTGNWAEVDFYTCIATTPRHHRHIQFWAQVDPEAELEDIADKLAMAAVEDRGIPVRRDVSGQWVRAGNPPTPYGWPHIHDLYDLYQWAQAQGVDLALPARIPSTSLKSSIVMGEAGIWNIFQFPK